MSRTPTYSTTEIVKLYEELGTMQRVADRLGCARTTVAAHLYEAGAQINPRGHRPKDNPGPSPKGQYYNCLVKWIEEHPDEVLPRSIKGIAEKTSCTRDSIKSWLRRQRRLMEEAGKKGLAKFPHVIKDHLGREINLNVKGVKILAVKADPYTQSYKCRLYVPIQPGDTTNRKAPTVYCELPARKAIEAVLALKEAEE